MDWIYLVWNRDKWQVLLDAIMKYLDSMECGMCTMSWLAQNLLVSQEGLCCLELVGLNGYLTGPELYLVTWQEMCQAWTCVMRCCVVWWIVLKVSAAGSSRTLVLPHYVTSHPSYAVLYKMAELPWFLNLWIVGICMLNCNLFVMVWSPLAMYTWMERTSHVLKTVPCWFCMLLYIV